ncbi:MAG: insulinase family protein [Anaerolineae bacterium]|nr:insulinase family protein [Anaerolineae bacterium]
MNGETQETTTLENGVRVLTEHMSGVRSVSVGVIVNVGSKDEQPSERGYAHLVEHMLFQGTDQRDARAIAEMMEVGGGAIGAFTTRDYTVYHATVLDEYLPFALEALGDMLCNSVLPEEALSRQRSVILNEIAGDDNPMQRVNDLLKATFWPDHPLGYPVAGRESTLREANRDSLSDFMRRHYIANKIILAAAGNVESTDFVAQSRDSFWSLQRCDVSLPSPSPSPVPGSVIVEQRDLQQVHFAMAWPAPPYISAERYAWHVFSTLFGGGATSRLYHRLREEMGMVYYVNAQYQAYANAGALVVEGGTLPQTLVPVLARTLIELLRMGEEDVDLDDHHRATQSLVSQHLVSGDSAYVRMSRLGLQELYFRRAIASTEVVDALKQQSPETIRQVAQQTFKTGLPTIAMVGPVTEELLQAVGEMLSDFGEPATLSFASKLAGTPMSA